jgi:MHS family proline/betaine transporter-like MFS transporter
MFLKKLQTNTLVTICNFLEFFDIYLYVHLGFMIQRHLFPNFDENIIRIVSLCSLYCFAPIACIFWGYIGDTKGRRKVLISSSFILAMATFLIAYIPEYSYWGAEQKNYGFIILMVLRMIQGMAIGGEPFAAGLYAMENVQDQKQIPVALAKMNMTEHAGGMLALFSSYIAINYLNFWDWSWRIPFILAGFSSLFVLYIRIYLTETHEYEQISIDKPPFSFNSYTSEFIKNFTMLKRNFFCNAILCLSYPVFFIFNFTFISPLIVSTFGYHKDFLITYNFYIVLGCFVTGYLAVKIPVELNWSKKITMATFHLLTFFCVIAFMAGIIDQQWSIGWYILIQIIMMTGIAWTLIAPSLVKVFPINNRFIFTTMGASLSRIFYFIVFIVVLPNIFDMNNVKVLGLICLIVISLAMLAVFLYVPYNNTKKFSSNIINMRSI